jgi:type 1 glutamine amidotransferase
VSGSGRYADPWHDFPATSDRIARIVDGLGHDVEVDDQVEQSLSDLTGVDLVIVNIGNPRRNGGETEAIGATRDGLLRHLDGGGSLLAVHSAATSFPGLDEWEQILGGRWVDGTSMHPKISQARITVRTGSHPIVDDLTDFTVFDERYSHLRVGDGITALAEHSHDDLVHPLAWARQHGPGRVVLDTLGHGVESYDSAGRVQLLQREIGWLLPTT